VVFALCMRSKTNSVWHEVGGEKARVWNVGPIEYVDVWRHDMLPSAMIKFPIDIGRDKCSTSKKQPAN
jgi:hypothetical protein